MALGHIVAGVIVTAETVRDDFLAVKEATSSNKFYQQSLGQFRLLGTPVQRMYSFDRTAVSPERSGASFAGLTSSTGILCLQLKPVSSSTDKITFSATESINQYIDLTVPNGQYPKDSATSIGVTGAPLRFSRTSRCVSSHLPVLCFGIAFDALPCFHLRILLSSFHDILFHL